MLSPSHDSEYFGEIHYASTSVITTSTSSSQHREYELDSLTQNAPENSISPSQHNPGILLQHCGDSQRPTPRKMWKRRPLRKSPGRHKSRTNNSNTKKYAKLLAGANTYSVYENVTPTLTRKPTPKPRRKRRERSDMEFSDGAELEKDGLESGTSIEHSKIVCVLLTITIVALLIALAAIALGLYSVTSFEQEKRNFVRQNQCTSTVISNSSGSISNDSAMISDSAMLMMWSVSTVPYQQLQGLNTEDGFMLSISCEVGGDSTAPQFLMAATATMLRLNASHIQCSCVYTALDTTYTTDIEIETLECLMVGTKCYQ